MSEERCVRRTLYLGVGFVLGVAVSQRARKAKEAALATLTPQAIGSDLAEGISHVAQAIGHFGEDVRVGVEQRRSQRSTVVEGPSPGALPTTGAPAEIEPADGLVVTAAEILDTTVTVEAEAVEPRRLPRHRARADQRAPESADGADRHVG